MSEYFMGDEEFNILVSDTFGRCTNTLTRKAQEYARGARLHNFHEAARKANETPQESLMGFKLKHDVSIDDIVNDFATNGTIPDQALLEEKIGDEINYYVLLLALFQEERIRRQEYIRDLQPSFRLISKEVIPQGHLVALNDSGLANLHSNM